MEYYFVILMNNEEKLQSFIFERNSLINEIHDLNDDIRKFQGRGDFESARQTMTKKSILESRLNEIEIKITQIKNEKDNHDDSANLVSMPVNPLNGISNSQIRNGNEKITVEYTVEIEGKKNQGGKNVDVNYTETQTIKTTTEYENGEVYRRVTETDKFSSAEILPSENGLIGSPVANSKKHDFYVKDREFYNYLKKNLSAYDVYFLSNYFNLRGNRTKILIDLVNNYSEDEILNQVDKCCEKSDFYEKLWEQLDNKRLKFLSDVFNLEGTKKEKIIYLVDNFEKSEILGPLRNYKRIQKWNEELSDDNEFDYLSRVFDLNGNRMNKIIYLTNNYSDIVVNEILRGYREKKSF